MITAKEYMRDVFGRLDKMTGGELHEDMEKHYKNHFKVVNSDKFKDTLAKCMNKNLDDPEKIKTILKSLCAYRIRDFIVDLYKFPRNIKNLNQYAFSICVGIYLLVFIGVGILVKLIFFSEKSKLY